MQRGNGGRGGLPGFGGPFGGFGNFGMSSFFGGRDPFDDPFFNQPFGSLMGPGMLGPSMFGSTGIPFGEMNNLMGPNMLGPRMLGSTGSPFGEMNNLMDPGMLGPSMFRSAISPFGDRNNQQQEAPSWPRGPVIEELSSDNDEGEGTHTNEKKDNPKKHSYVEDPDEEMEESKSKSKQRIYRSDIRRANTAEPQTRTYSFQSSTVSYGGLDGAYYTSSTTRRTGGDGVTVEESKEADTTTRKASHRISRGIHDKGHSVTRKLNSDGRVNTLQTLHNLNEDELTGFEEAWEGNARQHLPGWNQGLSIRDYNNDVAGNGRRREGRLALPSTQQPESSGRRVARSVPVNGDARRTIG